ncbi:adhesion G protein-coupled receptor L3-like [Branchiostoma lanceolatum]|uniref:adhesion G protein-coupled receptor L3-like n=1 Tax=Branchiostoma lanceolatum TaxID=7740 RepID=UPI003454B432
MVPACGLVSPCNIMSTMISTMRSTTKAATEKITSTAKLTTHAVPTSKLTTARSPSTTKPTTQSSSTTKPRTQSQLTTKPITQSLTTKPTTQSSSTTKPTTQSQLTTKPTTQSSTTKPTTQSQLTTKPTTQSLTRKPTTQSSSTMKVITKSPSKTKPTTQSPSTTKLTTQSSTTKPATESSSTKRLTTKSPSTTKQTIAQSQSTKPTTQSLSTTKLITQSPSTTKPTAQWPSTATKTKAAQSPSTKLLTSQLPLTTHSPAHCLSQIRRNINWPQTVRGKVSIQHCPNGAIARWKCSEMGTWDGTPDVNNCVSFWLQNITEARGPAEGILSNIADHLEREDTIYGGDVSESIKLLSSLIEVQELQLNNLSQEAANAVVSDFTNTLMRCVNALLRGNNVTGAAWSDIPLDRRSDVASGIMNSTEKAGFLFARTVPNKTLSIVMDNVVMGIGTTSDGGSTFPDLTNVSASSGWANVNDGITIPESQDAVVSVLYNSLGQYLQPNRTERAVNSRVISATLVNRNSSYDAKVADNVTIVLEHTNKTGNKSSCVFWDFHIGNWSDKGCTADTTDMTRTVCVCDHLTSFAILVDVTGQQHSFALSVITYIGCIISIVCLFFCICAFLGFRRVRCIRTIIHANLCICLLAAEIVFLAAVDKTENKIACDVIAIILHYLFLAVFTWMCVEGVELYVLLVKVFNLKTKRLLYYHLVGYGIPAIVVGVSAAINYGLSLDGYGRREDTDDGDKRKYCWLSVESNFIWSFVGPMLLVILVNLGFLALTLKTIYKQRLHEKPDQQGTKFKSWVRVSIALVCILGLTWVFGVLYINRETLVFAYVFTIINSFQGLFIFIFHCLLNEHVQDEMKRCFGRCECCPKKKKGRKVPRKAGGSRSQQESWLGDFKETSLSTSMQTTMSDMSLDNSTGFDNIADEVYIVDNPLYNTDDAGSVHNQPTDEWTNLRYGYKRRNSKIAPESLP